MIVNKHVVDDLYDEAGEQRVAKAKDYVKKERVHIYDMEYKNMNNFYLKAKVFGSDLYETYIDVENGEINDITCTCPDYYEHFGACKHIIATLMEFIDNPIYDDDIEEDFQENLFSLNSKYQNFAQITQMFYNDEIERLDEANTISQRGDIELIPKIIYEKFSNELKVEFKIGNSKTYKIKNLSDFYDWISNCEKHKYGAKLEFVHTEKAFKESSIPLLRYILKNAEIIKNVNGSSRSSYYGYYSKVMNTGSIQITKSGLDELFDILENQKVEYNGGYGEERITFLSQNPDIKFELKKSKKQGDYEIVPNVDIHKINIFEGTKSAYILYNNILYKCDEEFTNSVIKLLKIVKYNYLDEIILSEEQLPDLFSIVMPKMHNKIEINEKNKKKISKYIPEKLGVKIYLDFDEHDYIIADIKFCYGDEEFNACDEDADINGMRNMIEETKTFNTFMRTGFLLDVQNKRLIIPEEDKIFDFLSDEINEYMKKFEVLATDNFKTKQIKTPKIGSLGVKVENNLLSIDLSKLNIDTQELKEIMEKYNLKKKYHRLKNGAFLSLENNKDIEFIEKLVTGADIDYKDLDKGEVRLPMYRSLYLNQLLKNVTNTEIIKNEEYNDIVKGLDKERIETEAKVPKSLENTLRYYQKTGFKWLKELDSYKFGGILADDMGLGKTIQMLSIIIDYSENTDKKEKRASLVVSPSSLALNWQNEAKKFADKLQTLVISGTLQERKEKIKNIDKYDLVITSYDLLKRDIDIYKEKDYTFRYVIADEAQYLKNSNTQNAKSIKEIKADTRYALTGTPIENSLSEMWSIFDYIMPGYLFSYKKFKTLYETPIVKDNNEKAMEKLKMLIEPFVLRRTKKEVLTELPEKTITVLNNEMKEEQEKIYLAYLAQAKEEVATTINAKGFEKSQIQILAALTRLRQICCHPSLFIDGYADGSSKLEQCMEIITDGIEAGHKILLFSGYTSMFEIIEKELKQHNINYFKLTGSTKVDERIKLVDEFNTNKDISIFLISLKAGGTGLNLTGADMVIHYDPWWNASAENQATDRAYRIGQKNNVQVYKLITKNSIEEKIYELQQKKSQLIDNMLSTKTSFIKKLSKDDIMNLFES